ncbi:MAG: precorrin-2 C(20)-methyltransferase [Thermodesulfovibrio sp.]|nr:precorrin-2 C(20)-methyltransferase [Thermodesulfovibrio sp.]
MTGRLYVLGVGPGDPELMTLKSVRILGQVATVFVPKGREEGSSLALSIVEKAVDLSGKEIIEAYFPMKKTRGSAVQNDLDAQWQDTVKAVMERLNSGIDVAFITLGDPTIYSTFFYLHARLLDLNPDISIELVPGVSSITASAARSGTYLGIANDRVAILPANYTEDLRDVLMHFETVVLMKVSKVFSSIVSTLKAVDLLDKAVYVARAGMEDEQVVRDLREVREEDLNYFSIVIIRK